ncbi:probable polyamine transporter At1g31830 [Aristolochia californica]|uniref:probable polyamine transporter At1g31830 n=1 Tax=Aristolochia californica TaxID=171875 RepID=UPI0035DF8752
MSCHPYHIGWKIKKDSQKCLYLRLTTKKIFSLSYKSIFEATKVRLEKRFKRQQKPSTSELSGDFDPCMTYCLSFAEGLRSCNINVPERERIFACFSLGDRLYALIFAFLFRHCACLVRRSKSFTVDVAKLITGVWLSWWIRNASAFSNMGMFLAEMSSDSYQLLGMAERGMLPEFFSKRSRYGTPLMGILFSSTGVILLSWMSFQEIVAAENFLYCFGMILEFVAFIKLRIKYPKALRPYKIPLGTVGSILMCIPPTLLICVVLALASLKVMLIILIAVVIGLLLQPCLQYVDKRRWMRFPISTDLPDLQHMEDEYTGF